MELPGRRSNYSLLSQYPDDPPLPKFDSPTLPKPPTALQRQSSGSSSFGDASLSGDFHFPATLSSAPTTLAEDAAKEAGAGGPSSSTNSSKSWAQQAEETYQLQLALALRLCNDAACANDPYFLDADDHMSPPFERASGEAMSHRFWLHTENANYMTHERNGSWRNPQDDR